MGLLDIIKSKIGSAANEYNTAYAEAQAMDVLSIGEALKTEKGMRFTGYKNALKDKCEALSTAELKELYDKFLRRKKNKLGLTTTPFSLKTNHAADTVANILVERGVFTRNDDGTISEY